MNLLQRPGAPKDWNMFFFGGWAAVLLLMAGNLLLGGTGTAPFSVYPFSSFAFFRSFPEHRVEYIVKVDVDGVPTPVLENLLLKKNQVRTRLAFRYLVQAFGPYASSSPNILWKEQIEAELPDIFHSFSIYKIESDPVDEYLHGTRNEYFVAKFTINTPL